MTRLRPYILLTVILSLAFALPACAAEAPPPPIIIGVDAQPMANYDRAKAIGNTLVRFDPGPQKSDTPADCLILARLKGMRFEIQGTAADRYGVDLRQFADVILKVLHDDEPDLSRWKAGVFDPTIYTPADAPHPSTVGYTKPEVLAGRYKAWKIKWPAESVSVNFNGQSLTSLYYPPPLVWHAPYLKASDAQGFDLHVKNIGKDPSLFQGPYLIEKLRAAGGNPTHVYVEASDQKLGRGGRGPTPSEQGTQVWAALGHGVTEIIYFPQQIGGKFSYWAMTPENEQRAKDDYALITKYSALIASGTRTIIKQTPAFAVDYAKGKATWPETETFVWQGTGERLEVTADYVGGAAPVITYTGAPTDGPTAKEIELAKQLAAARADLVTAKAAQQAAEAALADRTAALQQSEATRKTAASQAATLQETLNGPQPPPATQPTTQPASSAKPVYNGNPQGGAAPGVRGVNYGGGPILKPWVSVYLYDKDDVQRWVRTCMKGEPYQPTNPDGTPYGKPVPTFADGLYVLDLEGYWDPNGDTVPADRRRPDWTPADVAKLAGTYVDWVLEVNPDADVELLGIPCYTPADPDGTTWRVAHARCKSVHTECYAYNRRKFSVDQGDGVSQAEFVARDVAQLRKLCPDKRVNFWVSPQQYDPYREMDADLAKDLWAFAQALGDSVVAWSGDGKLDTSLRVFGGMK